MNINFEFSLKFFNDFSNEGVGALSHTSSLLPAPRLNLVVINAFFFFLSNL